MPTPVSQVAPFAVPPGDAKRHGVEYRSQHLPRLEHFLLGFHALSDIADCGNAHRPPVELEVRMAHLWGKDRAVLSAGTSQIDI
jgi:hypothetical protein